MKTPEDIAAQLVKVVSQDGRFTKEHAIYTGDPQRTFGWYGNEEMAQEEAAHVRETVAQACRRYEAELLTLDWLPTDYDAEKVESLESERRRVRLAIGKNTGGQVPTGALVDWLEHLGDTLALVRRQQAFIATLLREPEGQARAEGYAAGRASVVALLRDIEWMGMENHKPYFIDDPRHSDYRPACPCCREFRDSDGDADIVGGHRADCRLATILAENTSPP